MFAQNCACQGSFENFVVITIMLKNMSCAYSLQEITKAYLMRTRSRDT